MADYTEASHEGIKLEGVLFESPKNPAVFEDVCWLSDGTLATLTGFSSHAVNDRIHAGFRDFAFDKDMADWQSVWAAFWTDEGKAKWGAA